jgi:hypothetical protein
MTTSENLITNHSELFPRVEIIATSDLPQFNGISFNDWEQNAIVIHKDNGMHIGGFCSEKYALVKNEDIFLPIADKLDQMFGSENVKIRKRWSKPYEYHLFFEMPNLAQGGKDALYPMACVTNSYTTQIPASQLGMIGRLICTNGLMTIDEKMQIFKIKHTKKETKLFLDMDAILKETEQVFASFDTVFEVQKAMNAVRLSAVKGANQIDRFESIIKGTTFPKKQLQSALNFAQNEAKQLKSDVTLWLAYNALNHILWHDKQSKMTQKIRSEIDQKLINRVHNLAVEMA